MKPLLPLSLTVALVLGVSVALVPADPGFAQERGASSATAQVPAPSAASMDAIRTDMEVLRRVIHSGVFGKQERKGTRMPALNALFEGFGAQTTSEPFYVHGAGLTLRLDVPFSVYAPVEKPDAAGPAKKEPSLWDNVLADVEGRPTAPAGRTSTKLFDPERLKAFETRLFDTLAKYAGRVRGMQAGDHLNVIVKGRTEARVVASRHLENGLYEVTWRAGSKNVTFVQASPPTRFSGAAANAGKSFLTVRISFADLQDAAAERITAQQVRERAIVHRY